MKKRIFSFLLAVMTAFSIISVTSVSAVAEAANYKAYDVTVTKNSGISLKFNLDSVGTTYYTRCGVYILAGNSLTTPPDFTNYPHEVATTFATNAANPVVSSTKNGNVVTLNIDTSRITEIAQLSSDKPYIWLQFLACGSQNNLSAQCNVPNCVDTVCLGKFSSLANFKSATEETYKTISIDSGITDGTVSVARTNMYVGDTVNVTATPGSSKKLYKLTYTPEGGNAVDITATKSFTMPENDVTVDAEFIPATTVAFIKNTYYESLQAAVTAATATDTIVMTANSVENLTIASGKTVTIDLNGYVLTGTTDPVIENNGTLIVIDSNKDNRVNYLNYSKTGLWTVNTTANSGIAISAITDQTADATVIKVESGCIVGKISPKGYEGGIFVPDGKQATLFGNAVLDDTTTSKGIEQRYTATVEEGTGTTDTTKVQVSWKLQEITVTVTRNKIWNTETLTWDTDTTNEGGAEASDPTAEFNFVNLSSKDIYAQLTFAKEEKYTEPTKAFTDNDTADGDGIILLGNKATDNTTDNTGKIKLALTVTDSDFKDITSDSTGTYGTYTVTISDTDPSAAE